MQEPPAAFRFGVATEAFSPTSLGTFTGVLNIDECPLASGQCLPIPVSLTGGGV